MRLQVANSTTTMYYSVTNAVPAKPYLPITSGANTYYLPLTTASLAGIKLKVESGTLTYRAMTYQSGYYNTTSAAVGNLSSTTALTRSSTSATLTRSSTSATLTRSSTSATLTRSSTSATLTRSSTSATLTRSSTSATLTRSSISGYATGSSTVNYTVTALTKVTTALSPWIFYTNSQNFELNQYDIATYNVSDWAGYAVSGHLVVERRCPFNNADFVTSAGNNFDKASYKFSRSAGNYAQLYLEYGANYNPRVWMWQANTTAPTATKSTVTILGHAPYGNTSWNYYYNSYTGTSISRVFSWTTWFFDNQSTRSINGTSSTNAITSGSIVYFRNIFSTVGTYTSRIDLINLFRSSYGAWHTITATEIHHINYREARVRETINTYSTKKVTTATLTRSSISGYATRSSISGYATRSSISGYATRSSISGYATRSSISGYATRSSISGYSGKLSSSKWA